MLSLQFQLRDHCAALQDRGVPAAVRALDSVKDFDGPSWKKFVDKTTERDGRKRYLGVPLHNVDGEETLREQARDFAMKCQEALRSCFDPTHPVARATRFLDFFVWPWQCPTSLSVHANSDVQLIADRFARCLPGMQRVVQQFVSMKLRMHSDIEGGRLGSAFILDGGKVGTLAKLLSLFNSVWKAVLEWPQTDFGQVQEIVRVALCVIEGGWSHCNHPEPIRNKQQPSRAHQE